MNLAQLLSGCLKALGNAQDWPNYFDLSRQGFRLSFLALILSVPCYYVCAVAVQTAKAKIDGVEAALPTTAFFMILATYALMFVLVAYILSLIFDRTDRFRAWAIVRHWSVFFASFLAACLYGLSIAGILPFLIASYLALAIYLGTLVIDIRLAQKIAGFEWGAAILAGCIITAMGLTVLMTGVAQFS